MLGRQFGRVVIAGLPAAGLLATQEASPAAAASTLTTLAANWQAFTPSSDITGKPTPLRSPVRWRGCRTADHSGWLPACGTSTGPSSPSPGSASRACTAQTRAETARRRATGQ